jgi:hypothetical protein
MYMRRMTEVALMAALMIAAAGISECAMAGQAGVIPVADQQAKSNVFAGAEKFAKGASDVTDVDLGPDMLGMVGGDHGGDLAHKMNFVVVHTYKYPKPGMYNAKDVESYRQKLKTDNWNCFVHSQQSETGKSTDVCTRPTPDHEGNEMVVLDVAPMELTFVDLSGRVSLADLMSGKVGVPGKVTLHTRSPQVTLHTQPPQAPSN